MARHLGAHEQACRAGPVEEEKKGTDRDQGQFSQLVQIASQELEGDQEQQTHQEEDPENDCLADHIELQRASNDSKEQSITQQSDKQRVEKRRRDERFSMLLELQQQALKAQRLDKQEKN